jgi:hypothetical protein
MTRRFTGLATIAVVGMLLSGLRLAAQQVQVYPDVIRENKHDVSPAMRTIHPSPVTGPPHVIQWMQTPHQVNQGQVDPVVQTGAGPLVGTTGGVNFEGVGADGYAPPDTNGAAGATQYVQWVNVEYAVFDKATGNVVQAPRAGNSIWTGFGGPCETNNSGDPIAQYDKSANRWVMAQPVFVSPYMFCVAVSTTSDATGAYNRYSFGMPNFPDYPKLGVWSDGYYASFNLFQGNSFVGAYACALDRNAMLNGSAATAHCFNTPYPSLLPSDLDGSNAPPVGSPGYFVDFNGNALELFKLHVDFATPANSTFTGPTSVSVAAFNEACGGGTCVPQLGTTQLLDSLGDRLMYRFAYRNFGDHESLVVSHSVGAGTSTGVRWYELRSPGSSPTVYQQGTYAPDSTYRWMGSVAMDQSGDMALGYSGSSSSINPAIRYTGRVPSDALGTLEAENSIIEGTGSQTSNLSRWGDYSSMSVDPTDDCTFWYTSEYLVTSGSFNWHTRVASFKFPSCGGVASPDFSLSASPTSQTVTQGNGTSYTVNVNPLNGFTGSVTFSTGSLPSGVGASFSPNPSASSTTMTVTTSGTTPAGTYTITVNGVSGALSHSVNVTLVVNAAPPVGDFSLSASPASLTVKRGSSGNYTVTVTPSGGFTGTVTFSVSGVPRRTSASFNPTSVTASGSTTLTVRPNKSAPTGTFVLTITGTSGSLVHSTTASLTVQ